MTLSNPEGDEYVPNSQVPREAPTKSTNVRAIRVPSIEEIGTGFFAGTTLCHHPFQSLLPTLPIGHNLVEKLEKRRSVMWHR